MSCASPGRPGPGAPLPRAASAAVHACPGTALTAPSRSAPAAAVDEVTDYRFAECRPVTHMTSGVQAERRAMAGGNLLSAFPRAELQGPAGRPEGLCDPPDDRSPDSRIDAERQSLPVSRPRARVGSLAGATLPRGKLPAEHSDRRPSAPACRPLPAYSGGTVWDSHPLPGIVGSRAVVRQYSTPAGPPRPGAARRVPHRSGPPRPAAEPPLPTTRVGPYRSHRSGPPRPAAEPGCPQEAPLHSTGLVRWLKRFLRRSRIAPPSRTPGRLSRHPSSHRRPAHAMSLRRPAPAGALGAGRRHTDPRGARASTRAAR